MKIVHIHQYFNDGMGYQENIFPSYQGKLGNEVYLITSPLSNGFNNQNREHEIGEYQQENFKVKRIPIKFEFKNRFVKFKELYKYLEELKPDYIYHHSANALSIKEVSKYKKQNPEIFLCVDNHADLNISGKNKIWKILYYNIFWKNYLKKYDEFIDLYFGVTPTRCLFLEEELGISNNKIRLLPIGADVDKLKIKMSREEVFSKYDLSVDKLTFVHGGKITKEKQIDRILEAFSQLEYKNIQFIIFGELKDENVKKFIALDARVKYIGWLNREETLSVLKYSDLGIWNTQHTTLLEDAVAVGLPMLLRYYGSTSHLIDKSGVYLYEGSVREIYDKLEFLIHNRKLIEEFKKNAKSFSEILSYDNISKESIDYMKDRSPKYIHEKFMSKKYSDSTFKGFRIINRE